MYAYQLRKTFAWSMFVLPLFKPNIVWVNTVSSPISEATIECSNSSIKPEQALYLSEVDGNIVQVLRV